MGMTLTGCSIKDETEEEIVYDESSEYVDEIKGRTTTERFIIRCNKCAEGDLSEIDDIVATYNSSFTRETNYPRGAFLYQKIAPTLAFERCAIKANLLGNDKAFKAMYVRPGKIARVARYFYAKRQFTQGAFWLQRITNLRGEQDGFEVAGRVLIQDMRTIDVGVKLLEQSARLGNRNARQMLVGLMNPGSPYYQQITTNTTTISDDERADGEESVEKEPKDTLTAEEKAAAYEKASLEAKNRRENAAQTAVSATYSDSQEGSNNSTIFFGGKNKDASTKAPDSKLDKGELSATQDMVNAKKVKRSNAKLEGANVDADHVAPYSSGAASMQGAHDALESNDMELNVPLEFYEKNETKATAPNSTPNKQTSTKDPNRVYANSHDRQNTEQRQFYQDQLRALEQKNQEAERAVQQKVQSRSNNNGAKQPQSTNDGRGVGAPGARNGAPNGNHNGAPANR